jgi:hypothetical protein
MTVEIDTDSVTGTGALSYQWQKKGSGAGAEFADIAGETKDFLELTEANFAVGTYIQVVITRAGYFGEVVSNSGVVRNAAAIGSVTIETDDFVPEPEEPEEGEPEDPPEDPEEPGVLVVKAGTSHTLKATVTLLDLPDETDMFQQVMWTLSNNSAGTTVGKYTGELTVSGNEGGVITVTATSVYSPDSSDSITLAILGGGSPGGGDPNDPTTLSLGQYITKFEPSDNGEPGTTIAGGTDAGKPAGPQPADNGGKEVEYGKTVNSNPNKTDFWFTNAKYSKDGPRYEPYFYLSTKVNATEYKFMSFEIKGEVTELMSEINQMYPRFKSTSHTVASGPDFIQFNASSNWGPSLTILNDGAPGRWVRVVFPIGQTNGILHDGATNYNGVMSQMDIVALRMITGNIAPGITADRKVSIRNLKLHLTEPRVEQVPD